jgi:MoxR-like ATPase
VEQLGSAVVGRHRELEVTLAALAAGRHLLLEGPPGTGKSTVLRAVARQWGVGFAFVEGNAELTPARLVGHFDPARVLAEGYVESVFIDGPLVSALRDGALLYIEEINRIPEETLNVLITVMSEGELHVPRLGLVTAASSFRLVAAMNPFDAVGTARISSAVYDRTCRVAMDYQPAVEEVEVVARQAPEITGRFAELVVDLVRRTREHPDLRVGSSVRGAIDMVKVTDSLARLRGVDPLESGVGLDAALAALSGRVRVREGAAKRAEEIITDLWRAVFAPADTPGKVPAPMGANPG